MILIDGRPIEFAVTWDTDDGVLTVYNAHDRAMFSLAPGQWEEVKRELEDGETWEESRPNGYELPALIMDEAKDFPADKISESIVEGIPRLP